MRNGPLGSGQPTGPPIPYTLLGILLSPVWLMALAQGGVYDLKRVGAGSQEDGTPRKLHNVDRLEALGWHASVSLADGIRSTYDWSVNQLDSDGDELRGVHAVAGE